MSASYLKLSLILILSFVVGLALIQTQPTRETDLRAFLALTEDCASPCLVGLRPGVTNTESAVQGLFNHPWVGNVLNVPYVLNHDGYGELAWTWSSAAPDLIDTGFPGQVLIISGLVQQIKVQTRVPLGDWQPLFGQPEAGNLRAIGGTLRYFQSFQVGSAIWVANVETTCPWSSAAYWNTPAQLILSAYPATQPADSPVRVIGAQCNPP